VPFTGDVVALTAQAAAGPGAARWLRLARVLPTAPAASATWPQCTHGEVRSAILASLAPCGGDVWISPFIPGRSRVDSP
jgi:hypothetical protein